MTKIEERFVEIEKKIENIVDEYCWFDDQINRLATLLAKDNFMCLNEKDRLVALRKYEFSIEKEEDND